jgi:hypothetical protein
MVCHFCYNGTGNDHKINGGTDNGVTIQAYTDQDTACHFCYGPAEGWHYHSSQDGSKYGMLVLLKRGMLFLLERNRGMTTIQARTEKSMVCHFCYGEAKNGTATYSRTEPRMVSPLMLERARKWYCHPLWRTRTWYCPPLSSVYHATCKNI